MARGRFITFEGGEGTGKSTQAARLADVLRSEGREVVLTREPGGSPFAEQLRKVLLDPAAPEHAPLAEALLFNAARSDHLETLIRPALASGRWVICDRFADSTRAYQGYAGGLDIATLDALERLVLGKTVPDLTLIVDLDPVIGLSRAKERRRYGQAGAGKSDPYECRSPEFHTALRQGFLDIAAKAPERCAVIDGSMTEELVAERVWRLVQSRLLTGADQ